MKNIECIARAVIKEDDKIILCHRKGKINWFFPGGHVELGETTATALKREIMEELGEDTKIGNFLGICENKFIGEYHEGHEINFVFEATLLSDNGRTSKEEHLEFKWFTHEEMKDLVVFPKLLKDAILNRDLTSQPFWVSEGF